MPEGSVLACLNAAVKFHELKCPGKEIFKATNPGPGNMILLGLVALNKFF